MNIDRLTTFTQSAVEGSTCSLNDLQAKVAMAWQSDGSSATWARVAKG